MQNYNITLRLAYDTDCDAVFEWRGDTHSRKMFCDQAEILHADHVAWFNESLLCKNRMMIIGEIEGERVGICRFDYEQKTFSAEISINLNPAMRGKGFSKYFLTQSINKYFEKGKMVLTATIRKENEASKKIFEFAGFKVLRSNDEFYFMKLQSEAISFKEVAESDADILFDLLSNRQFSISHKSLPSPIEHQEFVASNPYRYWSLIFEYGSPIGSFYIQNNNSIGVNLNNPSKQIMQEILRYIEENFTPLSEVKSVIPPYFYLNIAESNSVLQKILIELGIMPIQVSFKIPHTGSMEN